MAFIKIKNILLIGGNLIIGGIVAVGGYRYLFTPTVEHSQSKTGNAEKKVLFWYDPMYPNTKFDKPGKSPFMDMDLVPKYADEDAEENPHKPGIRIDPTQTQNLGLKTEKVQRGKLNYSLTIPAILGFNEYQSNIVQARADGFINKVYPFTVGDKVAKDTPLISVTIPEWVEAQSEYLLLEQSGATKTKIKGVLERLRLSGMPENNISSLKATKKVQTNFQINAPIDGVITTFDLRTGMNISKNNVIAQIQGVDPIWLNAAIPESVAYLIKNNVSFHISIPAYPEITFKSDQWQILPSTDPVTKTLQVRIQLNNKNELLKPGMNAYLTLTAQSNEMLLIPSQAVIDSGNEQRVIILDENGRFVPKQITVFHESKQQTAIISGLSENESVVTSGLFLIDSEANISGALERMRQHEHTNETTETMQINHTNH